MRRIALLPSLLLLAAACGGGEAADTPTTRETTTTTQASTTTTGATTTTAPSDFPVTVSAANGEVTIEQAPTRIVSLSPTATEILFAIGAGEQVVAVDDFSNHPQEAPTSDLSGFQPNVEAVAGFDPDLVVVSDDINDVVASLDAIRVPVIHQPAASTVEDTYAQIEQLGAATGNLGEATELVASMRAEIDALVASVPDFEEPPTYYHELDGTLFSVTSDTFIGQVYELAGLENVADRAEGAASLYPQLSAEFIIDADPDLVFLADTKCCGVTPETVAERPGWDQMTAVQTGNVVPLDDDVASRWGPRVVDFLRAVVEAVSELRPASGS